ncbi:MAG: ComF family protein [Bacillota bacterium]
MSLRSLLADLRTGLVRLFWPERPGCLWCGVPLDVAAAVPDRLCPDCRSAVAAAPVSGTPCEPLASVAAVGAYEGGLAQAIRDLKYRRRRSLVPSLGQALAEAVARSRLVAQPADGAPPPAHGPVLVPVPLHPSRFRERGFNQSELVGREVARLLGLPLEARALLRVRHTRHQARLGRRQRQDNLHGAFSVRPGWAAPDHVILIDDVYTTGATSAACAQALVRVGVRRVDVVTLAIER